MLHQTGSWKKKILDEFKDLQKKYPKISFKLKEKEEEYIIYFKLIFKGKKDEKNKKNLYFKIAITNSYPSYPPNFYIYTDKDYKNMINSPQHQYSDGSICLFPDYDAQRYWDPSRYSLKDTVEKLIEFAKSHYSSSLKTIWDNPFFVTVIDKSLIDQIPENFKKTKIRLYKLVPLNINPHTIKNYFYQFNRPLLGLVVTGLHDEERKLYLEPLNNLHASNSLFYEELERLGVYIPTFNKNQHSENKSSKIVEGELFFILKEEVELLKKVILVKEYKELFEKFSKEREFKKKFEELSFILYLSDNDAVLFSHNKKYGITRYPVIIHSLEKLISENYLSINPLREHLLHKSVTIVGLGSIGSYIASFLAKNQVGTFHLWDYDIIIPKNIPRHINNVLHNYLPKVLTVGEEIVLNNPVAKVFLRKNDPLNPEPMVKKIFINDLENTDLLILAGLDARSERLISEIAVRFKVPMLFVTTNYNATLGEIYRVFPGKTACWHCIRLWRKEDPSRFPRIDVFDEENMQKIHYENQNWPGLGIDTTNIALVGARFALQTLCRDFENKELLPPTLKDPNYDYIVYSNLSSYNDTEISNVFKPGINAFQSPLHPKCPNCSNLKEQ